MKITVLSENTSLLPELEAEYGLSIYLEKGNTRLLFDTGAYGACIKNAAALGISIDKCTAIAFSHNHFDHCGGFLKIAEELKPRCPVYAHYGFFRNKYWDHRQDEQDSEFYEKTLEHVGPPFDWEFLFRNKISSFRLLADDVFSLGDDIFLVGNFKEPCGLETVHPSSVMEDRDGGLTRDSFPDEQACVIKTSRGIVILTGCAHSGIVNIIETVKRRFPALPILAVFGGTHLVPPNMARIAATAKYFNEQKIEMAGVCHCTGPEGLKAFSALDCYVRTGAGFIFDTPD